MIKIYQKQPIQAEQFNGTSDSAKRLGGEWEDGNGFIGDYSYTPESQPCWYIPEDKFTVFGYDENSIKPDDWVIECSENIRLIMTNNEFKKYYAELPVIPKEIAYVIKQAKNGDYKLGWVFYATYSGLWRVSVGNWIRTHADMFARAWLDGYRVEAQHDTQSD